MLIIQDIFTITSRGTVVCGEFPNHRVSIKVGDEIEIKNPDGAVLKTVITGIEHICRRTEKSCNKFGLLVRGLTKEQIQPGAEINTVSNK